MLLPAVLFVAKLVTFHSGPPTLRALLLVHVLAGATGLVSGTVAIAAPKGGCLHRRSGNIFFAAMLVMAALGAVIASFEGNTASLLAALVTGYMVVTARATVRPRSRVLDLGALSFGLAIGLGCLIRGSLLAARGIAATHGIPTAMFFVFGMIAMLASIGDLRMIRAGGIQGVRRVTRHLWRMCFALFIATGSFFLGQARVIPKPIRVMPVLALLAFAPLLLLLSWLWRVRVRRSMRGIVVVARPGEDLA